MGLLKAIKRLLPSKPRAKRKADPMTRSREICEQLAQWALQKREALEVGEPVNTELPNELLDELRGESPALAAFVDDCKARLAGAGASIKGMDQFRRQLDLLASHVDLEPAEADAPIESPVEAPELTPPGEEVVELPDPVPAPPVEEEAADTTDEVPVAEAAEGQVPPADPTADQVLQRLEALVASGASVEDLKAATDAADGFRDLAEAAAQETVNWRALAAARGAVITAICNWLTQHGV